MQDEAINLDELTELENAEIFKLELDPLRPYEKDYIAQMDFTVEMNLSQMQIARAGYTFLDWLSDIGGMQGMLMSGIAMFLAIWNFNSLENHMVTRLFRMEKKAADRNE